MTYAACPPCIARSGLVAGAMSRRILANGSSRVSMRLGPAGSSSASSALVTVSTARLSASMNAIRSTGWRGSIGTYAAPAFHTPSNAATRSAPRSRHTPTTDSGPTPSPIRTWARRFARSSSSAYETSIPSATTATAPGSCASNRSSTGT